MAGWDILPRIVGLLVTAGIAGLLLRHLGQNVIVGYLLAGLLLGPTGVGLVPSAADVQILSELGVALLLFSIGLEFSFPRLRQLGRIAGFGGTAQVVITAVLASAAAVAAGVPGPAAAVLGMGCAMSSTAVVLRELTDRAQLESPHGRNAIGILLLQDIAVVPILIVTDALSQNLGTAELISQFSWRVLLVCSFVAGAWLVARLLLPRILSGAALSGSRELPVIVAVCVSIGAAWAAHTLGFSPSLGAFIAGIVLGESPFATQIRADVTPLTAVFVTLFFASVGTAVELPLSASYLGAVVAIAAAVMAIKALVAAGAVWAVQRSARAAIITGIAVSQIGEFTFVITETAHRAGILPGDLFQLAMAVSLFTLMLTPFAIGKAPAAAAIVMRRLSSRLRAAVDSDRARKDWRRVIVVGFGPAGQAVVQTLSANGIPFEILELNPSTVAQHRTHLPIELGDAAQPEVLQHAGIGGATALIVAVPDPYACRLIVETAQRLAPSVPIVARVRYHQYSAMLSAAGADRLVDEEELVGRELAQEAVRTVHQGSGNVALP